MSDIRVPVPAETPGEDLRFPPAAPVSARAHLLYEGWVVPIPTWDSMTAAEHEDHRDECTETCAWCEAHRAFGTCPACEAWNAEADDQGESRCCGMPVYFPLPEEDGPDRWAA